MKNTNKDNTLRIRVNDATMQKIEGKAIKTNRTKSEVVREMIEHPNNSPKPKSIAKIQNKANEISYLADVLNQMSCDYAANSELTAISNGLKTAAEDLQKGMIDLWKF